MSDVSDDDKTMGMIAHLLGIVTGFVGPLIIWLMNKDKTEKNWVIDQAKEALNFQITIAIAMVVAIILMMVSFGLLFFVPMIVGLGGLILAIMAGLKAKDGVDYRYPFAIRLIK
jgi:uncharacterized protein